MWRNDLETLSKMKDKRQIGFTDSLKMFFGIFMVLFYLVVAVAMAMNWFGWNNTPTWKAIRWLFAIAFGAYGIYRGYREMKGEHTYGMRRMDDEEPEQYSSYVDRLNDLNNKQDDEKR